jgi:hypothetical protein
LTFPQMPSGSRGAAVPNMYQTAAL